MNSNELSLLSKIFQPVVDKINEQVDIVGNWSNQRIEDEFGQRSANQIRKSRDVFYMNNCLPLSVLAFDEFQNLNLEPTFVIEEHYNHNRNKPGIHVGLEVPIPTGLYTFHFREKYDIEVLRGSYRTTRSGVESFNLVSIKKYFRPDKNIFKNAGAAITTLQNGDFKQLLASMQQDNSPEEYQTGFLDIVGPNPLFTLDFNLDGLVK